jgi:phosphoribosylaminoimidazole-succinocarboxamide synthase
MPTDQLLYRGSVKDLKGPVQAQSKNCVVFEYTDAYSVFDWGRMPDMLTYKGESLATLAADWMSKLEKPDAWKEFSKTTQALNLRKACKFGTAFNEIGEKLQEKGLRTHYVGVLKELNKGEEVFPMNLGDAQNPPKHFVVRQVSAVKPENKTILGRSIPDYTATRNSPSPRLIPLEVVFRFSCPAGSSLIERTAQNPDYLASIGFPDYKVEAGVQWDFPILELFTKLEASDRPITLSEALAISGLTGNQLQEVLLKTAWVAGFIKAICKQKGLELADGKLEWGVEQDGTIFLVDAIGPDELRILKNGIQLSKEFLRTHYRTTDWYQQTIDAKKKAKEQGVADWKKFVKDPPPALPKEQRELASQLYQSLANELTGREWFKNAWGIEKVLAELQRTK